MNESAKLAALAATIGLLVRLVKSEAVNVIIAKAGRQPIPKALLPWIALGLGALGGLVQSVAMGQPLAEALPLVLEGLVAGCLAVAGNEVAGPAASKFAPGLAAVALGKKSITPPAPKAEEVQP